MSQKEERITEEGFGRKENIREYCTVWKNIEGVHNSVVHFLKEKSFFLFIKDHLHFCILSTQIKTVCQTKIVIRIKI